MKQKKSGVRIVLFPFVACVFGRLRLRVVKREIGQKKAVSWTKKTDTKEKSKPQRTCNETNPKTKQKRETKKSILSAGNVTVS